jgi:soluble lytic murein transglycosylase-like protein
MARRSRIEPSGEKGRARGRSPDWALIGMAAFALGAAAVASVVVWNRLRGSNEQQESALQPPLASASVVAASAVPPIASATAPSTDDVDSEAELASLREKAHATGVESPELRAWIDQQAVLQSKLLQTGRCEGSAAACAPLLKAREELRASRRRPDNLGTSRRSISATDLRPRWLLGLALPQQFPIDDHERVELLFEKYSDTPTGRAAFESLLFRCGKYREIVQAALVRYDLPPSLFAVVYAESGCNPVAKSPVGAEGLWQFMPEAAKAYHLRIIEDVVDERHSPQKSTEAAVHFLADLYRKFKSWDLVFAAYNMGPYGLAARMHVAGGDDVGFWDLLDADLLPSETANYVPTIEAFALISENLTRLKFAGAQMAPPEVTARLDVPPGTRLSLIARAASISVTQLRQLNPDLKADAVPNLRGELFPVEVPQEVALQARAALRDLIERRAVGHLCVTESYDWGKEQYTPEMEEACRLKLGAERARDR